MKNLPKSLWQNLPIPNLSQSLFVQVFLVLACLLSTLASPALAQAQTKRLGLLLGVEGVVSLPLNDRREGTQTKDDIGIGGRIGLQAGALYRNFGLIARTRVGGTTIFPSPPDLTFDLYMTYTLPVKKIKPWIGLGYSALFPSAQGKLPNANRPHPYNGVLLVVGNRWGKGLYSEYGIGYYPYSASGTSVGDIRESLVDITVSLGYRHIFRF